MVQAEGEGEKWLIRASKCRRQPASAAAASSEIWSQSNGSKRRHTFCALSVVPPVEALSD
jgi:hypothetical protein